MFTTQHKRLIRRCAPAMLVFGLGFATIPRATQAQVGSDLVEGFGGFVPRPIQFTPCPEDGTLDCGTLTVPVDYRKPFGEKLDIAVIRAKATGPGKRIGVLVGNPGGPGPSGVDQLLGLVRIPEIARARERFDIIGFDSRGIGRSRQVTCKVDFGEFPGADGSDEELAAYFDESGRRFAQACREQNGSFVGKLGTANVARDMDMIRRGLGERQISYASGSYGSVLGATYASMFPERVRAMMLDGAVAPEFRDYFVETWQEFSSSFEHAFQRLDQLCRRDPACALAESGVVPVFDEVAGRLADSPVTSPDGLILNRAALQDIVAILLDRERNWPLIVTALAGARESDFGLLFQILPFVVSEPGTFGAFFPITCADYGTRRSATEYLPVDEANGSLFPRFFGRFFVAGSTAPCTAWPAAEPPAIRNVQSRIDNPILIVGNDFDTRTPLNHARRLARALGAEKTLVRYLGSGHTGFLSTTDCVDDTILDYLLNLRIPKEGATCAAQPISFEPGAQLRKKTLSKQDLAPGPWGPSTPTSRIGR